MNNYIDFTANVALMVLSIAFWGVIIMALIDLFSRIYYSIFPYKISDGTKELEKSYKRIHKRWKRKQRIRKFFGLKYEE